MTYKLGKTMKVTCKNIDIKNIFNIFSPKFNKAITVILFCVLYGFATEKLLPAGYYGRFTTVLVYYGKSFSVIDFIFCTAIAIFLKYITDRAETENGILNYILQFMYWLILVPVCLYPALFTGKYVWQFWISFLAYWCVLCFASKHFIRIKINITLKTSLPEQFNKAIITLTIILIVALIVRQIPNFKLSLSLNDVYSIRSNFKSNSNDFMTFFKTAFGTYICPCFIVYSLEKGKKSLGALFIILQIILFSLGKDKVYLFLFAAAIAIGLLSKWKSVNYSSLVYSIPIGTDLANILALIGIFPTLLYALLVRRIFQLPAFINYLYFEFFTDNPKLFWRQDVFLVDKLFTPVYSKSRALLIDSAYFGGFGGNPNAGLLAEAYSQFGYLGIIIYPFILVALACVIDTCYKKASNSIKFMLSFGLSISFSNDAILSTSCVVIMLIVCIYSKLFVTENNESIYS